MSSIVNSLVDNLHRAQWISLLKLLLIFGLAIFFASCRSQRSESRILDGLEIAIWVNDSLLQGDEPFDIRFTLTNSRSSHLSLDSSPEHNPPAQIVVRVPAPSGQEWQEAASWSEGCGTIIELDPGGSCSLTATWAISQDLGVDAAIVVGAVWYQGQWQEVAVGVAQSPSPF